MKLRYIGIVRVSSQEQAERNLSIPNQIEQIENYCKLNNIELVRLFREETSAFKGPRPIFNEMVEYIKKSTDIDGLVTFKWDRISRNIDDFTIIDKVTREKNIEIISLSEPLLNSYMGRYMVRDMQNRSILYSEELSFRVKLGIRKKLQNGGDIGGPTPFGYIRSGGCFVPHSEKSIIVKDLFELYSTGVFGYKSLTKKINEKYNKKFYHKHIESILNNTIYYGIRTKVWNLSKDEYFFWGVPKAGTYIEEYPINGIIPLIQRELYEKCSEIKNEKNKHTGCKYSRTGDPKIFTCSCGRIMLRDDKKGNRYLKCPKQINNVFPVRCNEGYFNLKVLEKEIKKIILKNFPNEEVLKEMIQQLKNDIVSNESGRRDKLIQNINKLKDLNQKQEELTQSYLNSKISKEMFEKINFQIENEIKLIGNENKLLKNHEEGLIINNKMIELFKYMIFVLDKLKLKNFEQKSSQSFQNLFNTVENLVLGNKKVLSYKLKAPFNFFKTTCFSQNILWFGM
ncbi:MAG: recombinase family protein [Candidatus Altimarinota bacterium]